MGIGVWYVLTHAKTLPTMQRLIRRSSPSVNVVKANPRAEYGEAIPGGYDHVRTTLALRGSACEVTYLPSDSDFGRGSTRESSASKGRYPHQTMLKFNILVGVGSTAFSVTGQWREP